VAHGGRAAISALAAADAAIANAKASPPSAAQAAEAERAASSSRTPPDTPEATEPYKRPLVKEYYETGGIDHAKMRSVESVQPQCPTRSAREGRRLSHYSRQMKKQHGFE